MQWHYIILRWVIIITFTIYRYACAIEMTDSVIMTGGGHSYNRVQEYNLQGSMARLPDLNTGRQRHACGYYVHQEQMVSTELRFSQHTQ